ncbi:AAA+-type ATPase, SpoVK/Ycf46/Vps4 family [Butyrivibrio sp. ob235]|uniref:AAA family ATPase n=1 Tax=Butyrivibrio sp. ob235 TaxID=1761780 RepID=UPI0008D0FD7C|nr:AAA family ATPase [Butyrivibrio sp. ob235]SEL53598.1 AAA+-type ATPase, SpoVK/Ycf46/Vps4 family [Butyrivibrio sp. ob235]
MQFFEGELKYNFTLYSDTKRLLGVARQINTKYWLGDKELGIHILMSNVTMSKVTILVMYEGNGCECGAIFDKCVDFSNRIMAASNISDDFDASDRLTVSEITLNVFDDLFREEWFEKLYDDKAEMYKIISVDYLQFICKENLLDACFEKKTFRRRYIPRDELLRIREKREKYNAMVPQPMHYIVAEADDNVRAEIDDELIYELRKAGRITSRRYIKVSGDIMGSLSRNNYKIQNLNNLDGGFAIVELNCKTTEDANALVKSVYSEYNHYSGNYIVIFHVSENDRNIIDSIHKICSLWPFVQISNKELSRKKAVARLREIAEENNLVLNDMECMQILPNGNSFTFDEINTTFRKWYLTKYVVDEYYPQYRNKIDEYFKDEIVEKDALLELQSLVGLNDVKHLCKRIIDFYALQKLMSKDKDNHNEIGMHMVFTGNPGTAKTTVARLMARILKQRGILSKGELIEVGRADLVGQYVGWTAKTVKDYFIRAKGSVLFIDEAYSLSSEDKDSFGIEAINTIVQEMENHRDEVVVIFAGYKKEMRKFIESNSGLRSRVSFHIDFPDYSGDELFEILKLMAREKNYSLKEDVYKYFIKNLENYDSRKGNGRIVRNMFEKARMNQAERIMKLPAKQRTKELYFLTGEDFGGETA